MKTSRYLELSRLFLKLMFRNGALVTTDNELVQSCIKGLSSMFRLYNTKMTQYELSNKTTIKPDVPLESKNIRSLLQLLTVSVMEITSIYQNAAFQLIKEILNTRILLPEIYEMITKLGEQIVLSQRKGKYVKFLIINDNSNCYYYKKLI